MGGVGLDLLAQRCDVDVYGSSRWHRIVAPDLVKQLIARQQRVPMLHEIPQKLVLEGREGQRLARPENPRSAKVYSDIAESESLSRAPRVRAAAPQQRFDPREKLDDLKRLDEIVVCTELQTDDAVRHLAARGQHENRHSDPLLAKLPAN